MEKSILEKMEEAVRRPVPYEGMKIFAEDVARVSEEELVLPAAERNPKHRESFVRRIAAGGRKPL